MLHLSSSSARIYSNILCIIPARGGSKGIPRKNLQMVNGRPLLVYSIEQARSTARIKRVIVSTDDSEIAAVARRHGAEVVARPASISGDKAASEAALLHVLDVLAQTEGYEPDLVVFLQVTSPVRRSYDIQRAIEVLEESAADSLFTSCAVQGFIWTMKGEGLTSVTYNFRERAMRQDLSEVLMENGSIYVFKPAILRNYNNRLGGKIATYKMGICESHQIDEVADLELIEKLMLVCREQPDLAELDAIRLLVLDFDGVLTDNKVLVDESGKEAVWCDRGDSLGLAALREAGVDILVLSKEKNPVVGMRCKKLQIECIQGCDDKLSALKASVGERGLIREHVAYFGNDVNDLECLRWVGLPICVGDANQEVRLACRLITAQPGGRGAVREVADLILSSRKQNARLRSHV